MIAIEVPWRGRVEAAHSLRIGREAAWADVVLDASGVSRCHLEIRADGSSYRLFDMGSSNGTTVNGKQVGPGGRVLAEGDVIGVGGETEVRVLAVSAPPPTERTRKRGALPELVVELEEDRFLVSWRTGPGSTTRDTMPFQLGLALSVLGLYQLDRLGPVPDSELRALVWRGDSAQQQTGDINRLLLRLRRWFRDRGCEPPPIVRPKGSHTTRLEDALDVDLHPDGWLYRYLDRV